MVQRSGKSGSNWEDSTSNRESPVFEVEFNPLRDTSAVDTYNQSRSVKVMTVIIIVEEASPSLRPGCVGMRLLTS